MNFKNFYLFIYLRGKGEQTEEEREDYSRTFKGSNPSSLENPRKELMINASEQSFFSGQRGLQEGFQRNAKMYLDVTVHF